MKTAVAIVALLIACVLTLGVIAEDKLENKAVLAATVAAMLAFAWKVLS